MTASTIPKKTAPFALLVLATLALAGCTPSPSESTDGAPAPSASAEVDTDAAFAEAAKNSIVGVTVLEVVDPRTFVVGPNEFQQEENGYTGQLTVSYTDVSRLVTAAEGECGYDETLAAVKQYFVDHPDAEIYVEKGVLFATEYNMELVKAGLAYIRDVEPESGNSYNLQMTAQESKLGLWGSCPGFGE